MRERLRNAPLLFACCVGGLLVLAAIIRLAGASPVNVAQVLWAGAWGSGYNASETLAQTAPLLFSGLAVALAFRCKLFNIGAEGQLLVGAMGATWAGTQHGGLVPAFLLMPFVLVAGALAGAFWSGIAGVLKIYRGVPEVLSTLLLNFVALQAVAFAVRGPLQEAAKGFPQSDSVAVPARIVLLVPKTHLHGGVVLALIAAVLVWGFLQTTRAGFALKAVGAGSGAAELAGISVRRTVGTTFLLSGALAGLAGAVQISGVTYLLSDNYSPGYGYSAIAVALLADLNPLLLIPSALFFGTITSGGFAVQQKVPGISLVVVQVLQAVTLLTLLTYAWAKERLAVVRAIRTQAALSSVAAPNEGGTA